VLVLAAVAGGTALVASHAWTLQFPDLQLVVLILASILTAVLRLDPPATTYRANMPPSLVLDFTSLLLAGPAAAMLVVAARQTAHVFLSPGRLFRLRVLVRAGTALAALAAAGFAYQALGGTVGRFAWPLQGLPIAAAAMAYCCVRCASADLVVPVFTRRPVNHSWLKHLAQVCPTYFIGTAVAVALAEAIGQQIWEVLPVAAVPLVFGYTGYCDYLKRLEDERRRLEVIDSLDHGMAVIDRGGRITLWNDVLERITGCPRQRALGRSLVGALPVLSTTELPQAASDALARRLPRTLPELRLGTSAGVRILEIKLVPVSGGLTLLWHDVTERSKSELALRRIEQRFALAAEGANDGLWEWDLRTQELYVSRQWRALVGVREASAGITRPQEWLDRVHVDDLAALKQALEAHLSGKTSGLQHEHRIRHEDGTFHWFLCRGVAARGAGRRATRIAGSLTDTTEQALAQERLRSVGFRDPLTGLCNRAVFVEGLGRRLEELKKGRGDDRFAVLYLDLDRFKVVNDSLGHLVGDELLVAASRRLESCLRPGDTLARLGGDEFSILLNGLGDETQANAIAFRIQDALSAPFSIGGREVFTSASIGIAPGLAQYANPDEIMRDADTAMYHAKARGKARHELFDADMHARARNRLGLENDLRHAVQSRAFEVHYQPIVSLASGRCVGFESLVRWTRNGEAVSPATFIPIAEELGLIETLGTWVLQQACATFADWQRRFPSQGLDCITVNVSSRQLMQQNFLLIVEQAVRDAGLKPCDLRLEITETALMDSPNLAAQVLRELRDAGVKIYLDDFGTGYSSLSHLHKLPVDALKIDRSFVTSLLLPERAAIVESILALARTMKTSVVAEGIESDVQARELARLGCTHAQGYVFSRPLSTLSAEELLIANVPLGPQQFEQVAAP
jgi:diguanylate cyclase (GGDEF)-like protein/PAS domain S-box-containing protein